MLYIQKRAKKRVVETNEKKKKLNNIELAILFILFLSLTFAVGKLIPQYFIKTNKANDEKPSLQTNADDISNKFLKLVKEKKYPEALDLICYEKEKESIDRILEIGLIEPRLLTENWRIQEYQKVVNPENINAPNEFISGYLNYLENEDTYDSRTVKKEVLSLLENNSNLRENLFTKQEKMTNFQLASTVYQVEVFNTDEGLYKSNIEFFVWKLEEKKQYDKIYSDFFITLKEAVSNISGQNIGTEIKAAIYVNGYFINNNFYYYSLPRSTATKQNMKYCISGIKATDIIK